jgi:hypothetical protein
MSVKIEHDGDNTEDDFGNALLISDEAAYPPRPKSLHVNITGVLESLYPGFTPDPEQSKAKFTAAEKQEYKEGRVPHDYSHHSEELNEARIVYYKNYFANKDALEAWGTEYPAAKKAWEEAKAKAKVDKEDKTRIKSEKKRLKAGAREDASSGDECFGHSDSRAKRQRQCMEKMEEAQNKLLYSVSELNQAVTDLKRFGM